jgi:two-component system sensor histidine kinase UhpB
MPKAFNAKIMVVEDEQSAALDIQKILQNLGHTVTSIAASGEEALRKLERLEKFSKHKSLKNIDGNKPDLALIDAALLENGDGIEVANQIRHHFDIPVVYLIDSTDESTLELARATEPFGYILKPFEEREFHTTLEMAFYKHAIEEELKERKERLDLFMDSGTDSFLLLDSELNIVEINRTGLKSYAPYKKDLIGKNISNLVPDLKKTGRYDRYLKVIKTGEPYFEDCLAAHPKLGDRYINLKAFKVGDGLGMIITDITDQKKAEQALYASEERYRLLVESINEGLIMLDENHVITFINDRFLEMNGFLRDEIIGHCITDFLDSANSKIYREQMARRRKGECGSYEVVWKRKDGRRVFTAVSAKPIFDGGNNFRGSIAMLTDVTDRRRVEEELKSSQEILRRLSHRLHSVKEKESARIAREIHDELGQLLTALKMDLSWLHNKLPEDQEPLLYKIESMSELVDTTIRTVQRISSELRPGVLDDLGLIPALEWQAQEFERRTKINCQLSFYDENLELDPDRSTAIFRIFQEALTNVARHANATKVNVSLNKAGGRLILKVRDNGKGISIEKIYASESLGIIGMRERILPWQGGTELASTQGKGTTLTVILPLERSQTRKDR